VVVVVVVVKVVVVDEITRMAGTLLGRGLGVPLIMGGDDHTADACTS
jgi:hypothetical protein